MRVISPRRPWHSSMTVPVYSLGVMIVAESIGSSMWSSRVASGSSVGLSTSSSVPSVRKARYSTLGAVAMSERSNSRSRRSRMISMCKQPEEPAAEADAERVGGLGLEGEAGVVELQAVEGVAQVGQLVAVDGVEPAEDHGLGVAVAGERGLRTVLRRRDRLARARLADVLDPGDEVADLAGTELLRPARRRACARRPPRCRAPRWPA